MFIAWDSVYGASAIFFIIFSKDARMSAGILSMFMIAILPGFTLGSLKFMSMFGPAAHPMTSNQLSGPPVPHETT